MRGKLTAPHGCTPLVRCTQGGTHNWINNGLKGVDFATNTKCAWLDYSTVHLWVGHWAGAGMWRSWVGSGLKTLNT